MLGPLRRRVPPPDRVPSRFLRLHGARLPLRRLAGRSGHPPAIGPLDPVPRVQVRRTQLFPAAGAVTGVAAPAALRLRGGRQRVRPDHRPARPGGRSVLPVRQVGRVVVAGVHGDYVGERPAFARGILSGRLLEGQRKGGYRGEEQHVAGHSRIGRDDVLPPGATAVPCGRWTIQAGGFPRSDRQEKQILVESL